MSDMIADQKAAAKLFVGQLLSGFAIVAGQQQEANEKAQDAMQATDSQRESDWLRAAQAAFVGKWGDEVIEYAIAETLSARNEPKRSTSRSFASTLRVVMHPNARGSVANVFSLGNQAWEAERAAVKADKASPEPLAAAFKKRTFMLLKLVRAVRDANKAFASVDDIVAYGVECDPATDEQKIFDKLKGLREKFQAVAAEFPLAPFADIDKFLGTVTVDALKKARDAKLGIEPAAEPAPSNLRKAEPAPAPAAGAPVEGASDIVSDALRDANAA